MKKKLFSMLLLGACFLASMSLFTSCKDYDDDIKSNQAEIVALRSELLTVKTNLEQSLNSEKSAYETQIAALKAQLESAISNKVDEATVNDLKAQLDGMEKDYAARMAVLTSQIEAAYDAIGRIDQKADQSTVDGVIADLAALTGKLDDEAKAREAVEANLRIQLEALQKFMNEFNDANLQEQIDQLKVAIGEIQTNQEITVMRSQMTNLEQLIVNVNANLSALEVLVERMLNSISLVPKLFINGIEAIEFLSLQYSEPYATGLPAPSQFLISNGETEAIYRLNPTTVQRTGIDEEHIDFLAAKAEARETRALGPMDNSPVTFNGIKSFGNGLMTVKLKKTTTAHLGDENDSEITIVALKVPRNPNVYEPADIISENSRLVEKTYTPRIASLDGTGKYNKSGFVGTEGYYDGQTEKSGKIERPHHYSSEAEIMASRIDENPFQLVSKIVYYRDAFDVKTIVTGCLMNVDYNGTCNKEIKPADLKKYGITYRYSIKSGKYTNGTEQYHETDQQQFAVITSDGIITSKTPAGVTDNKAVIGKEPIVRIEMVDTVHNKTVDVRYLKIKWTDKKEEGPKKPDPVFFWDKQAKAVLSCNGVKDTIYWDEFIDNLYAKCQHISGLAGLSQKQFHEIYGPQPSEYKVVWDCNWTKPDDTSAPKTGRDDAIHPIFDDSWNIHGDASTGTWTLMPEDIKTVYCNSKSDTKTFTATIWFRTDKVEYPDLYFTWSFTISLPAFPEVAGFYEQYWLPGKMGQEHDILPLQWDTDKQRAWRAKGKDYCFYDNDLTNAFWGTSNLVTKIPACGSWDIQFSYAQSNTNYQPNYSPGDAADNSNDFNTGGTDKKRIYKSGGKFVNTRNFADMNNLIDWDVFGGYDLRAKPIISGNTAMKIAWYQNPKHQAWNNRPSDNSMCLFADHNNSYNWPYLNALGHNDITGPDGTKQPERTHTKPVDITIWGALNAWNYIPLLSYKTYLVAPLRINWKTNGFWQDGEITGSPYKWSEMLTLTDFRGYLVQKVPDGTFSDGNTHATDDQWRWTMTLWNYYEVQDPEFELKNARFAFKKDVDGNLVVDNNINLAGGGGMTASEIKSWTQGKIDISFQRNNSSDEYIYFFNNGGSNIEEKVKVLIPVSLRYGFGILTDGIEGYVYPHGEKPAVY